MSEARGARSNILDTLMALCDPMTYLSFDEPDWLPKRPPAGFQIMVSTPLGRKNKFAELMEAAEERE